MGLREQDALRDLVEYERGNITAGSFPSRPCNPETEDRIMYNKATQGYWYVGHDADGKMAVLCDNKVIAVFVGDDPLEVQAGHDARFVVRAHNRWVDKTPSF